MGNSPSFFLSEAGLINLLTFWNELRDHLDSLISLEAAASEVLQGDTSFLLVVLQIEGKGSFPMKNVAYLRLLKCI